MVRLRSTRILLSLALAACSASGLRTQPPTLTGAQPAASRTSADANLYVANYGANTVTVYGPGQEKPLRTISDGLKSPYQIAFDRVGNLYVANDPTLGNGSVTVYAAGTAKLVRTITQGIQSPSALIVDRAGTLYVANHPNGARGSITVYAPGDVAPRWTILHGVDGPNALVIDRSGTLYVANLDTPLHGEVTAYGPKGPWRGPPALHIIAGIRSPYALALDKAGRLYIANASLAATGIHGTLAVYVPKKGSLHATKVGIFQPEALAVSSKGVLYVTDTGYRDFLGVVTWYSLGPRPQRLGTITNNGLDQPQALAVDPDGNVYVGNGVGAQNGTVTVYQGVTLLRTIKDGINRPFALEFNSH